MKAYVVVEGVTGAAILRAILPAELLNATALVPAGDRSSPTSIARSLIVTRRKPVAVLVEADSIDEGIIQERRQSELELLKAVAAGVPIRVIVVVPVLEVIFFQVPGLLQKAFGGSLSSELLSVARSDPKEALTRLLKSGSGPSTLDALLKTLAIQDVEGLRATGPIRELIGFLTEAAQEEVDSSQ